MKRPLIILLLIALINITGCVPEQEEGLRFERSSQEFSAQNTYQIALGDVDGDGDLDAILANMQEVYSRVLLNDGSGHFTDSGQQLTQYGHGVVLEDLDGDGDLDAFFTCANYVEASKIYLNDGAGGFTGSVQVLNDVALSGNDLHLFDLEGDGDLDARIVYYQAADSIYLNDGAGRFSGSGRVLPENTTIADLDGDGDNDLFIKDFGIGYRTMVNDGAGNFSDHWQESDPAVTYGRVALGDIDQDGDRDAFVTNGDNTNQYPSTIWLNDGTGQFTDSGQELSVTWHGGRPFLGDLDGDGNLDALVTNFGHPNEIWLGDGAGGFSDSGLSLSGDALNSGAALGDLDGDGDMDIFLATYVEGANEIWFNETD